MIHNSSMDSQVATSRRPSRFEPPSGYRDSSNDVVQSRLVQPPITNVPLQERVARKFEFARSRKLLFCDGYKLQVITGEACFKFRIYTAQGLSKKTFCWSPTEKRATNEFSVVPGAAATSLKPLTASSIGIHKSKQLVWEITETMGKIALITAAIPAEQAETTDQKLREEYDSPIALLGSPKNPAMAALDQYSPFVNPEPELTIGSVGTSHSLLLNKYCVLPRQLLLVTNRFEPQEGELQWGDWRALVKVMAQLQGKRFGEDQQHWEKMEHVAFFNCGRNSGASQEHRHIHIAEWPVDTSGSKHGWRGLRRKNRPLWFPDELCMVLSSKTPYTHPRVPFAHFILRIPPLAANYATTTSAIHTYTTALHQIYLTLLSHVSNCISTYNAKYGESVPAHYNMLLTADYMMLIPRRKGYCEGPESCPKIWANSLGMVGEAWVKDEKEAEGWKVVGCQRVLKEVGVPKE
ncbi:hypothetical protein BDZ91DRAFT_719028 [Kalaharituber pfeilii]|nr:hypothetical protein BDZ91DRAFT_719028 [Kalaharituber pfeilii]